jgi:hypothetical protein
MNVESIAECWGFVKRIRIEIIGRRIFKAGICHVLFMSDAPFGEFENCIVSSPPFFM